MLAIGMLGYLLGAFISVVVLSGITAVVFVRQARTLAYGGPVSQLLRAHRIVITDQNGTNRAMLDSTGLRIADDTGEPRIVVGTDNEGPALQVWDQQGRVRLSLGSTADGTTGLMLVDEAGKTRGRAVILSGALGVVSFAVNDQNGNLRGDLTEGVYGARLNLCDENGKSIWQAPDATKSKSPT